MVASGLASFFGGGTARRDGRDVRPAPGETAGGALGEGHGPDRGRSEALPRSREILPAARRVRGPHGDDRRGGGGRRREAPAELGAPRSGDAEDGWRGRVRRHGENTDTGRHTEQHHVHERATG